MTIYPFGASPLRECSLFYSRLAFVGSRYWQCWSWQPIKILNPEQIPKVQSVALYIAMLALVGKELLFRYMLKVAKKVKSSMLVANAWHARSDAASSLVVLVGIAGNSVWLSYFLTRLLPLWSV